MKKRILTIIGTRPQFIKASALSKVILEDQDVEETLVHTGQHFDANMSEVFFKELLITKPKHTLNINGGLHGQMTGLMLEAIDGLLIEEKPDAVLVYGDTNSTLAGALAAVKQHITVIHVEAGLRSYNKQMPEEINRVITDHISNMLFCPTISSIKNLEKEGIINGVHHVGDIMYDASLNVLGYVNNNNDALLQKFSFFPQQFALMTVHRAESTENQEKFQAIIEYAQQFAQQNNLQIIFPVHPRTKHLIDKNSTKLKDVFVFTEPLSYFETQYCLSKASYVLTDSGGLQKEAYFHRVPCITLRSETEWVETITHGWNRLWTDDGYCARKEIKDYGNGHCAEQILNIIKTSL